MFKSAATRIAHNTTLPVLAGNNDLKLLQDVITSEKIVLQSLYKMSIDFTRSTEALRHWALCEGQDLGDTLSACATLFTHFSNSLASFSNHVAHIRELLKAVRTREEGLDEQHRRRKSLFSKADSAEKKLNKMSSDNKNIRQQTEILLSLKEQIRGMDVEIMNEEASIGDWKRSKAREWMGFFFGGLMECCEKGTIVAAYGRSIVSHIPNSLTEPGLPREPYYGHPQVEQLVVDAERKLFEIAFNANVNPAEGVNRPRSPYDYPQNSARQSDDYNTPIRTAAPLSEFSQPPPSRGLQEEMNEFGAYVPEAQRSQTYAPDRTKQQFESSSEYTNGGYDGTGASEKSNQFATFPVRSSSRVPDSTVPERRATPSQNSDLSTDQTQPHTPRLSQRLSATFSSALGSGWSMDGGAPRLDASANSEPPSPIQPPQRISSSIQKNTHEEPKPAERRLTHRLSSSMVSAMGSGWSMDGGAPRLDASSSPIDSPSTPRAPSPIPTSQRSSSTQKDNSGGASSKPSLTHRLSTTIVSALGAGWSMDGGTPRLDGSSSALASVDGSESKSLSSERRESAQSREGFDHQERHSSEGSVPSTTLGSRWNMDGGTTHLDPSSLPQQESSSRPSPFSSERSWTMDGGVPRLDTSISPDYYAVASSPHIPLPGLPPGAASPVTPVKRSFEQYRPPHQPNGEGQDDDFSLAYMSRDSEDSSGSRHEDRKVRFGGQDYDERSLNAQAAREISKQLDEELSLVPPSMPFAGRRSVSPRPSVVTDSPQMSYTRGQGASSSTASTAERPSALSNPYSVRSEVGSQILPAKPSVPPMRVVNRSPDPYDSPGYLGNSPVQSPVSPPASPVGATISAAAFRRPVRNGQSNSPNVNDEGVADTSPLNLRKRHLPALPAGVGGPRTQPPGGGMSRLRSSPTSQGQVLYTGNERASRGANKDEGVLNDDFDYISAYINDAPNASPVGNYESGRFA